MFMQKLQNPFLKPTPYFSSNSYTGASYAPPIPPTSKYSSYVSYENERPSRYDSYSIVTQKLEEPSEPSRYKQSADIKDILRNNPFTRPSNSIFGSSATNSYSPAKYQISRANQNGLSTSYQRKQANDSYTNSREKYGNHEGLSNQYSQKRLTPKKHDNYLSTSSADSAGTYINKIYQLDDEKSQASGPINNPFFRKNLLEDRSYQRQMKPINSYDNATIKYIAGQRQYQQPPKLQNNYFISSQQQNHQYQSSKIKSKQYIPSSKNYADLQYKRGDEYGSRKNLYEEASSGKFDYSQSNPYSKYQKYDQEPIKSRHENIGSKHKIEDQYNSKYDDNRYESKYDKYDYEQKGDIQKTYVQSKTNIDPYQYESNKYSSKKLEDPDKFFKRQEDSKFDFSQSQQNRESKKYNNTEMKDEYGYNEKYGNEKYGKEDEEYNYKYSFKQEYNENSKKDISKQSKKSQEKINFQDCQNSYSYQSSKLRQKEYPGAFQTLGGAASNKYKEESHAPQKSSKKLISSQVEQYETYRQNIKNKDQDYSRELSRQEKSKNKNKYDPYEQDEEEDYNYQVKSKKGPVRDVDQNYPAVIHYNGMVFSRIQIK